ncbi:MAG TPA: GerAB/ArcD/ProY family transporter [Bacillota bacterium]|nr:GerAB/ArcD/ProY family transporter [Bacillota bacterium]
MILHPKDKITPTQAALSVASTLIASGILTLPHASAKAVGAPDAWISVAIGGILALIAGFMVARVSQLFPQQSMFIYCPVIFGKWIGNFLALLFILYCILIDGYEVRVLGEVVREYVLDKTPIEVTIILFMCAASYLTVGGINPIVRVCELYFMPTIIVAFFLLLISTRNFEINNVLPIFGEGILPTLKGVKSTILAYIGFENMLIWISFMDEPRKAVKSTLLGIGIAAVLYVLIVFTVIGNLSFEEVTTLTWPTMSLAKAIEFPGSIFERLDSLFVIIWVIAIYTTFVPFYYSACLGLGQLFRRDHSYFVYAVLPFIYIAAMYLPDLNHVFKFGDFVSYLGLFFGTLFPIVLWIVFKMRKKKLRDSLL